MKLAALTAVLAAACTEPTSVSVELAFDRANFIAYRDGTGAWRTPSPQGGGTYAAHHYELDVTGDYELVAVSVDPITGTSTAEELRATAQDGTHWYLAGLAYNLEGDDVSSHSLAGMGFCTPPGTPLHLSGTAIVSGTMAQPGQISIGGECTWSTTTDWSYRLAAPPGVQDVIATDRVGTPEPRIAILRGVDIETDAMVPEVDLATQGQSFDSTKITVIDTGVSGTNPPDAVPVTSDLWLRTPFGDTEVAGGDDHVASTSHTVPLVPASLLGADDTQEVELSVTDDQGAVRHAFTRQPDQVTAVGFLRLPPLAVAAVGGVDIATWGEPLSSRIQIVDLQSSPLTEPASGSPSLLAMSATKGWLDSTRAVSLSFDLDVPGFDPSWAFDVTQPHYTTVAASSVEGLVRYSTSWWAK